MRSADILEDVQLRPSDAASPTASQTDSLDDSTSGAPPRDAIRLLLQSPAKLFLYWTHAHDPRATLREAFGELAARYRLMVRLVKVESGEEFMLPASPDRVQWFEVYPSHVYRADVGFFAEGRPFVCLLASNVVETPPDAVSSHTDAAPEFQSGTGEFARVLSEAGYERYALSLTPDELTGSRQDVSAPPAAPRAARVLVANAADEYPHH